MVRQFLAGSLLALCSAGFLAAQPQPAAAAPDGDGAMHLNVEVTNARGTPVGGLAQRNFTLLDNKRPVSIRNWKAQGSAATGAAEPVQAVLVMDTVNMEFRHVAYVRQEVTRFLRRNNGHLAVPVSIYAVTDESVDVISQPSRDGNIVADRLAHTHGILRDMNRRAGDYGAGEQFQISLNMLGVILQNEVHLPGRKLLIWLGPGWPWLPDADLEQPLYSLHEKYFRAVEAYSQLMREADTTLYSVSIGDPNAITYLYQSYLKGLRSPGEADTGNLSLKVLTVQSGGLALDPNYDLARSIALCVQDASAYYTLSFTPPAGKPDEYHSLQIRLDQPGLKARTTTGYYAKSPPGAAR